MRSLQITEVASASLVGNIPFSPGATVVAVNMSATAEVLQSSDASGGSYTTIATIGAGESAEITINNSFLKLVDAGFLTLLTN